MKEEKQYPTWLGILCIFIVIVIALLIRGVWKRNYCPDGTIIATTNPLALLVIGFMLGFLALGTLIYWLNKEEK